MIEKASERREKWKGNERKTKVWRERRREWKGEKQTWREVISLYFLKRFNCVGIVRMREKVTNHSPSSIPARVVTGFGNLKCLFVKN